MKIGVVDYGAGNLRSVLNAVESLGYRPQAIRDGEAFSADFTHIVLPGVGAFGDCRNALERRDLLAPLTTWIREGKPYFGICVGYQILFESSEESPGVPGLGIFEGHVRRFPEEAGKIPHMGWNAAEPTDPADVAWKGLALPPYFYFVHSYYPVPVDESIIAARTIYGSSFASAIRRGNLFATQFHAEKSQAAGLGMLKNFFEHTGSLT